MWETPLVPDCADSILDDLLAQPDQLGPLGLTQPRAVLDDSPRLGAPVPQRPVNNLAVQSLVAAAATNKPIVDESSARAAVTEVTTD